MKREGYEGFHLLVAGLAPRESLDSKLLVSVLLWELVELIKMRPFGLPIVKESFDQASRLEGCSGFIMVKESHIALHTWIEEGSFELDVFSCRPFSIANALSLVERKLKPNKMVWQAVKRSPGLLKAFAGGTKHSRGEERG